MTTLQFKLACYALIRNDRGEILLLQRPPNKKHFPNKWEFPGGKVDQGESLERAVCREAHEEAGLIITPTSLAGAVDFPIADFRVIMLVFNATCQTDHVTTSEEHQAFRWVALSESLTLEVTDQVRHFVQDFLSRTANTG